MSVVQIAIASTRAGAWTDQQQQQRQQMDGITRHTLWEAAAAATQKQQRQALHILALFFSSSFTDTCKITFTFPNVSVIFYTETFVYPEFREGLPKLLTVPAYCKH